MAFKASDRRHHAVEFIRNPVSSYFHSQVFYFYAIEFTRTAMNRHFRSQVRLSCDGKLTCNRANRNFHPQPAIVILAPICLGLYLYVFNDGSICIDCNEVITVCLQIYVEDGRHGEDLLRFTPSAPSSVTVTGPSHNLTVTGVAGLNEYAAIVTSLQ